MNNELERQRLGGITELVHASKLKIESLPPLRRLAIVINKYDAILITEMQMGAWEVEYNSKRSKKGTINNHLKGRAEDIVDALKLAEALVDAWGTE